MQEGPAPLPLTEEEELALNLNRGRPAADGVSEGSPLEAANQHIF